MWNILSEFTISDKENYLQKKVVRKKSKDLSGFCRLDFCQEVFGSGILQILASTTYE